MQTPDPPFDPYHIWLAIPPDQRPPDLYQLLGLQPFESDVNVITNAVDQRMRHVKSFATGPHGNLSQQILNELGQAKVHLINPQLRAAYDARLRAPRSAAGVPTAVPLATPVGQLEAGQTIEAFEAPQAATSSAIPGFDLKTEDRGRRRNKPSSAVMAVIYLAVAGIIAGLVWIFAFGDPTFKSTPTTPTTSTTSSEPVESGSADNSSQSTNLVEKTRAEPTPPVSPPSDSRPSDSPTDASPEKPATESQVTVAPPPAAIPSEPAPDKSARALDAAIGLAESPMSTAPPKKKDPVPLPADFKGRLGRAFRDLANNDYASYLEQRNEVRRMASLSQDQGAIDAVSRLEQMSRAVAKVWEFVHIAIRPLRAMSEIQGPDGNMAAVVEAGPDKLILRADGQTRRYAAEMRGPMKVFPNMTGNLASLLAIRVEPQTEQSKKAISFIQLLANTELPANDSELWQTAEDLWASNGLPPAEFFGIPTRNGVMNAGDPEFNSAATSVAPKPSTDPGFFVARFQFDGSKQTAVKFDVPPEFGTDPKMEVSRVYLGPTLGVHTPSRWQREVKNGSWEIAGKFVKLMLRTKTSGGGVQAQVAGQYRRDSGSRFRFERIELDKLSEQLGNISNALTKKRIDVDALVRRTLQGGKPLDLLNVPNDANLTTIIGELGTMPPKVDSPIAIMLRMQQVRDFAKELQEAGWVELKVVRE